LQPDSYFSFSDVGSYMIGVISSDLI